MRDDEGNIVEESASESEEEGYADGNVVRPLIRHMARTLLPAAILSYSSLLKDTAWLCGSVASLPVILCQHRTEFTNRCLCRFFCLMHAPLSRLPLSPDSRSLPPFTQPDFGEFQGVLDEARAKRAEVWPPASGVFVYRSAVTGSPDASPPAAADFTSSALSCWLALNSSNEAIVSLCASGW